MLVRFFSITLCMLLFSGCGFREKTIVIGIVPSKTPALLKEEFGLIKLYLEKETGCRVTVYIPEDYRELIKAMKDNEVDIGLFGPFSYIIAEKKQRLIPLLVRKNREYGITYNSVIITKSNSGIKNIYDLKNRKMAFVNTASTSGFMIPQSLFVSRDIDINIFLSGYYFSGSHDKVIADVLSGKADAGAASNTVLASLIKKGEVNAGKLRILWKSDPIPGSPYVARADFNKECRELFVKAMLDLHIKDPDALMSFDSSIEKYTPFEIELYNGIRSIVSILGYEYIEKNFI